MVLRKIRKENSFFELVNFPDIINMNKSIYNNMRNPNLSPFSSKNTVAINFNNPIFLINNENLKYNILITLATRLKV